MKWIFLLLLLVNVSFFGWQVTRPYTNDVDAPAAASVSHYENRLVLLSEVPAAELRRRDGGAVGGNLTGASCFSVGPLSSEVPTTNLRAWLEAQGAKVTLRNDVWREQVWYWVYFEPFESRAAAQERVRSLEDEGLRDISVIARGDMANAVSLGVYARRSSLDKRLAELQARGYNPAVLPRHRTQRTAWFEVHLPPDSEFPLARLRDTFPDMEVAPSKCG